MEAAWYRLAEMIRNALDGWMDPELELLFIENVGNLVCPSSYDLGENLLIVASDRIKALVSGLGRLIR